MKEQGWAPQSPPHFFKQAAPEATWFLNVSMQSVMCVMGHILVYWFTYCVHSVPSTQQDNESLGVGSHAHYSFSACASFPHISYFVFTLHGNGGRCIDVPFACQFHFKKDCQPHQIKSVISHSLKKAILIQLVVPLLEAVWQKDLKHLFGAQLPGWEELCSSFTFVNSQKGGWPNDLVAKKA